MDYESAARSALERHGFRFTHSLGQNFLLNREIIARIADAAGVTAGANVLEIGAGAGVLTAEMAGRGAFVTALEIDRALGSVLEEVLAPYENARVVFEDAMKCDLAALVHSAFSLDKYQVVANLPYHITSDILQRLLALPAPPASITVMVQKEAAERIMAWPGQKAYSQLAATIRYHGEAKVAFAVPACAFTPPPHVESVLLKIELHADKPVKAQDDAMMRRVIQAAFAMRRKTLANNLTAAFSLTREAALELLDACGLDSRVRGEALTMAELARVADQLATRGLKADVR